MLYLKQTTNAHYLIKIEKKIFNSEQFIYKYFLYLKQFIKINFTINHLSKFSYLIKYNYFMLPHEYNKYVEEKIICSNLDLTKKINKLIILDNKFFYNVLSFLNNSNNMYNVKQENAFAKNWLYGGRVEIINNIDYLKGDFKVITFDFPSAYFNELKTGDYPDGDMIITDKYNYNENQIGFVDCNVTDFINNPPVLPVRFNNRVIYPKGNFSGIWFTEELNLFLQMGGRINKINKYYYWEKKEKKFTTFCNDFDLNTNSDDPIIQNYIKKLKLSFFGSFAQNSTFKNITYAVYDKDKNIQYKKSKIIQNPSYTNYIVASIITASCRIKLYNFFLLLLKEDILVLSLNIDSITVYLDNSKLNYLKTQYPLYKNIWEKNTEYYDVLNINNGVKFFCKNKNSDYINYTGLKMSTSEMEILKKNFFSTSDSFTINHQKIPFNTYFHRNWINERKNTTAIIINYK